MRVQSAIHIELAVHTKQVKEDKLNLSDSLRAQACQDLAKTQILPRPCQDLNQDLNLYKTSILPSLRSCQDLNSNLTYDQYLGGLKAETRVSTRSDIKTINSQGTASSLSLLNHVLPIGNCTHDIKRIAQVRSQLTHRLTHNVNAMNYIQLTSLFRQ